MNWLRENLCDAVSILQTNADYENQGIFPRTCTCDSIRDAREGERSYAFSEDFEDKIVYKTLTSRCEDIHLLNEVDSRFVRIHE